MIQITIDCAEIATAEQFHSTMAQALSLPEHYGHNLDALFDCLTENRTDRELIFQNWHTLQYALKDYAEKILYVFKCACDENNHLTVTLHP